MKELGSGYEFRESDDTILFNVVNDATRKRRQDAEDQDLLRRDCSRRQAREKAKWRRKERRVLTQCGGGAAVIALAYMEMCRENVSSELAVAVIIGALVFVCVRGGWHLCEARWRR